MISLTSVGLPAISSLLSSMLLFLAISPGLILLLLFLRGLYNLHLHPLSTHPGPLLASSTRFWWIYHHFVGDMHHQLVALHRRYGPVVRIAPDEISYTHPGAWKEIQGARPGRLAYERDTHDYITDVPDIMSSDRVQHARIRRLLSHGFSDRALGEQEGTVQGYVDELMSQLRNRCEESEGESGWSEGQNMALWLNFVTFDTIGHLVFGEDFNSLGSKELDPYIAMIFQGVKYMDHIRTLNRVPGFQWLRRRVMPLAMFLRDLFVPQETKENQRKQLRRTKDMVDRRMKRSPEYIDLVDKFVQATEKGEFSVQELYQNSDLLLLAGSETVASLLSGAIFYLTAHKASYDRLAEEVRGAFSQLSDINIRTINQRCPYLIAVLFESLRMYPPAPALLHRVVQPEGDLIAGRFVPGGTTVGINQVAIGRDPLNFRRSDEFIPERWLKSADSEEFRSDCQEAFMPFGDGPRNCVGKNLANMEIRSILAKLVWWFDMEIEKESSNWMDVQDIYMGWQKGPLMVRLRLAKK